jgi:NAD(P)-dependent dehydrogenase (short-subunit alcohol dehydrogenase family)
MRNGDPADRPVALITGASRGIGAATAAELARRGYALVLAARSGHDLHEVARALEAAGGSCHTVPTDVRRKTDLERLARAALERFGRVDVLIHNAGIVIPGRCVSDLTDETVADVIGTNLMAPIELTRALLPPMIVACPILCPAVRQCPSRPARARRRKLAQKLVAEIERVNLDGVARRFVEAPVR